jgi:hypothetical protein
MPKKSGSARGGAQRHKVKVQKNIELVRKSARKAHEIESEGEPTGSSVSTMDTSDAMEKVSATTDTLETESETADSMEAAPVIEPRATRRFGTRKTATAAREETPVVEEVTANTGKSSTTSAPRGNASARLAARRQTGQKSQQRAAATLVTSEHYRYVRKDLIFIAILALLMFAVLIILHFVPAIGG